MRHLGGVAIGVLGTLIGLVLLGLGFARAAYALQVLQLGPGRLIGAALLLLGGVVVGAVILARRLSAAAPLTGGVLLLLLSLLELAVPGALLSYRGRADSLAYGLSTLLGFQVGMGVAGIMLVAAFAGRRSVPATLR